MKVVGERGEMGKEGERERERERERGGEGRREREQRERDVEDEEKRGEKVKWYGISKVMSSKS